MQAGIRHRQPAVRRSAFSLIELMVVVVIIAILTSLLLVGVNAAREAAQLTKVKVEMSNLSKSISDFKLEFGVEPPSFLVLYENNTGAMSWADDSASGNIPGSSTVTWDQLRVLSRAQLRAVFPNYNFTTTAVNGTLDINRNGVTGERIVLNGAECLAFFLGGISEKVDTNNNGDDTDPTDGFQMFGFSSNPENPFGSITGNRIGPFLATDSITPNRIVDGDASTSPPAPDYIPELYDPLSTTIPGQSAPYQYFSSYDGAGYRPLGLDTTASVTEDDEGTDGNYAYVQTVTGTGTAGGGVATFWNPNSHQIVCAGRDAEIGNGGGYNTGRKFFNITNNAIQTSTEDADNLANFGTSKTLGN